MFEKYYKRIQFLMHNPLWGSYLMWAYKKGFEDLKKDGFHPNFSSKSFTALLCGTAGSTTSKTFAKYVFSKNPEAKLIILDLGEGQINDSKEVLTKMFPGKNVIYLCEDALKTSLSKKSVDYIETDGIFEFFSYSDISKILKEWNRILKNHGFITFRAYVNNSLFTQFFDSLKIFIGDRFLYMKAYSHQRDKLIKVLNRSKFKWANTGGTFLPGFLRFIAHK